jgi:glucose-6-phosphate isomerase
MTLPNETAAWKALEAHAKLPRPHLRELLADEARSKAMFVEHRGITLDYSRQLATPETVALLLKLADETGVRKRIDDMFAGVKINTTEDRAVLHVALRAARDTKILVDGVDQVPEVYKVLDKIKDFSEAVRSGKWVGATGKPLTDVVCIGIGGSFLGPLFVHTALECYQPLQAQASGRRLRFLANIDPEDAARALSGLNPETTLAVVVSKTFTTAETMLNARTVRAWIVSHLGEAAVAKHVVAVSTALKLVADFGIDPANAFGFWDWVGGRYSCSAAVGILPLALQYGYAATEEFLAGLRDIDNHFRDTPFDQNIPVLMGLLATYNASFLGVHANALLPYSQALSKFAPHIQQVSMESNGKRVTLDGTATEGKYLTGEIIFGEPGTNGQHSFYQLIHQGRVVSCDFIGFAVGQQAVYLPGEEVSNHDELMSNFFAQADALAYGKTAAELDKEGVPAALIPHKTFPGDRPSLSLLFPKLGPFEVGQLLAVYEHRIAVQGALWGINSFDQWGVELGKVLAKQVRHGLTAVRRDGKTPAEATQGFNYSTRRLMGKYLEQVGTEAGAVPYGTLFEHPFDFFAPGLEGAVVAPKFPTYKKTAAAV